MITTIVHGKPEGRSIAVELEEPCVEARFFIEWGGRTPYVGFDDPAQVDAIARTLRLIAGRMREARGPDAPRVTHELKTWPEQFEAVRDGSKTFELRLNDRGFAVGDILRLREWDPDRGEYSGRETLRLVCYLLRGGQFGLPSTHVIMALAPTGEQAALADETIRALRDRLDEAEKERDRLNAALETTTQERDILQRYFDSHHQDAERWRALMQHVGPLHDQLHAIEQAVSGAHRALHDLTGHPGGPR